MDLKPIITDLFHLLNLHFGIHRNGYHETSEKLPFYLPFWKAEDTPSPSFPRVRDKVLQLHPWRLRSGAFLTFATSDLPANVEAIFKFRTSSIEEIERVKCLTAVSRS